VGDHPADTSGTYYQYFAHFSSEATPYSRANNAAVIITKLTTLMVSLNS
jgi:hypothetical protein